MTATAYVFIFPKHIHIAVSGDYTTGSNQAPCPGNSFGYRL